MFEFNICDFKRVLEDSYYLNKGKLISISNLAETSLMYDLEFQDTLKIDTLMNRINEEFKTNIKTDDIIKSKNALDLAKIVRSKFTTSTEIIFEDNSLIISKNFHDNKGGEFIELIKYDNIKKISFNIDTHLGIQQYQITIYPNEKTSPLIIDFESKDHGKSTFHKLSSYYNKSLCVETNFKQMINNDYRDLRNQTSELTNIISKLNESLKTLE